MKSETYENWVYKIMHINILLDLILRTEKLDW